MKKKKEPSADGQFLIDKINAELPALPEELSPENITALVAGKKQKTPKRRVVKRFVAAAVAACVVICTVVVYDSAVYSPRIAPAENNIVHAESYTRIADLMNDYYKSEKFKNRISAYHYMVAKDVAENVAVSAFEPELMYFTEEIADSTADSTAADMSASHSETNLREAGADEADIVKTDGEYIYAAEGEKLYIVKADGAELSLVSVIEEREAAEPRESSDDCVTDTRLDNFYLYGDRLIVNVRIDRYEDYTLESKSGVRIYDIRDKASPVLVREVLFDGSEIASRVVNGQLLFVTGYTVDRQFFDKNKPETFIPSVCDGESVIYPAASDILIADTSEPDRFLTVAKLDLCRDDAQPRLLTVFGAGSDIYCNNERLYVFMPHYSFYYANAYDLFVEGTSTENSGSSTDILAFDISGEAPVFTAKGCVKGLLLNTWSADEYNGYLRLAATDYASYVYVLDRELKQVGVCAPIAAGEQIKSVRFSGDTAYVVTFYQTDPLFVLDLSDPAAPTVKGELKLPGFSEYLHPAGSGLMLGVGRGGDENGLDGSAKISLFDVSDPQNPREVDSLAFKNSYFETDYRAFVSAENSSFILPLTRYENNAVSKNDNYYYDLSIVSGAVRVSAENGELKLLNEYKVYEEQCGYQRAVFINDTVYTLILTGAQIIFTAFGLESGVNLGSVKLP